MDRIYRAENLIGEAEDMCRLFLEKCADGRAKSRETKRDMERFMNHLAEYRQEYGEVI